MDINEILEINPYSLSKEEKHALLNERLHELTIFLIIPIYRFCLSDCSKNSNYVLVRKKILLKQ